MTDVVERAKAMITTLEYAQCHGITQAYPDSIIKDTTVDLVTEVERVRLERDNHKLTIDRVADELGVEPVALDLWAARNVMRELDRLKRLDKDRRERDGDCPCDPNPETTDGPQEDCAWHGRPYGYWIDLVEQRTTEVERLKEACKTLGEIITRANHMVLDAAGAHDLIGEDGDGDWMAVFERLAELRPARDQANEAIARVRAIGERLSRLHGQRVAHWNSMLGREILTALDAR